MKQPNKSHWDVVFPLPLSLTLISLLMCSSSHSAEFLSSSRHLASQSSSFLHVTQFLLASASLVVRLRTSSLSPYQTAAFCSFHELPFICSSLLKYRGSLLGVKSVKIMLRPCVFKHKMK